MLRHNVLENYKNSIHSRQCNVFGNKGGWLPEMNIWLATVLLSVSVMVTAQPGVDPDQADEVAGWEAAAPPDPNAPAANWVDNSHNYVTTQAQALTVWMDNFFGDPDYNLEQAESQLRLEMSNDWDQEDGYNGKLRLRGKVQLPRVSRRLNLIFNQEEGDKFNEVRSDRQLDDQVGLLYNVLEKQRSRLDLTLGLGWLKLRPGVRYRYQGPLGSSNNYRFTQRVQYENSDGFYSTSQLYLDHLGGQNTLWRWDNRLVYGEETDGVEWRTGLSLNQRYRATHKRHQLVIRYFGTINGVTDPDYVKNYRLGMLFRRQAYRDYLFFELEPSYNFRKNNADDSRSGVWDIVLRVEMALERDLLRHHRQN